MLDPSIPLMAKGIDSLQMLDDGSKLAQLWQTQKTDAEMNRLYKESSGDLDKMLEIGKQSPMARYVIPQLQAQKQAQIEGAIKQQKDISEIGKTQSETQKNTVQTQGYGVDNSVKLLENANRALKVAAQTGDANAAKMALNNAYKAGAITPELYDQYNQQIDSLSTKPEELMQFAQGIILSGEENAMKYIQPDQNTILDNKTSTDNNIRTNETQRYGIRTTAETADENRAVQVQQLEFEKGKISPLYTEGQAALKNGAKFETIGGVTYIDLGNGKGIPYVDQDGKPLSATSKANGVPKLSDNALKQVNEASTQLSQARQSYTKIGGLVNDLKGGKLDLSASNIVAAKGRMALGLSTPNDLAIDRFQAALNQAANDVLMMAKGTQTEGDAQRAVATITANPPRDNNAAMQALNTLAGIQRNTINTLNGNINTIYDNYGIARPGASKPSKNSNGSPSANTGGRSSLSSILFE